MTNNFPYFASETGCQSRSLLRQRNIWPKFCGLMITIKVD